MSSPLSSSPLAIVAVSTAATPATPKSNQSNPMTISDLEKLYQHCRAEGGDGGTGLLKGSTIVLPVLERSGTTERELPLEEETEGRGTEIESNVTLDRTPLGSIVVHQLLDNAVGEMERINVEVNEEQPMIASRAMCVCHLSSLVSLCADD